MCLHSVPPKPLAERMNGVGGWSLEVMALLCLSFLTHILLTAPLLIQSLSMTGPLRTVPALAWATHGHSPLLLSHRTLPRSETPAVSPASVPICTSPSVCPQMCPHVAPQVNSQVSPASVSSHPFLDTSKDHTAPAGCSFGAPCGASSCGQSVWN